MINIMIADDDSDFALSCYNFLSQDKDINIVSCTNDGKTTLSNYKKIRPDILLLDLNMPKMSGIDIINKLSKEKKEKNKCNIIVMSGNKNLRYQLLNTSKVFKIIPKPFDLKYLLKTIKEIPISNTICQKKLRELLLELRFNLHSIGTNYLIDMINMSYNEPKMLYNIKDIYIELGKKYNVPPNKIKWSVRNSIDSMNRAISINDIITIFPFYDKNDKLTTKFFLNLIIEYFSNE